MLVDTSVWIDHFRRTNARLVALLEDGSVECHAFVIGELACGSLRSRVETLSLLGALPAVAIAGHDEAREFLERHRLAGRGIGWIDVHLLAAAALGRTALWTLDRRLDAVARSLGLGG